MFYFKKKPTKSEMNDHQKERKDEHTALYEYLNKTLQAPRLRRLMEKGLEESKEEKSYVRRT